MPMLHCHRYLLVVALPRRSLVWGGNRCKELISWSLCNALTKFALHVVFDSSGDGRCPPPFVTANGMRVESMCFLVEPPGMVESRRLLAGDRFLVHKLVLMGQSHRLFVKARRLVVIPREMHHFRLWHRVKRRRVVERQAELESEETHNCNSPRSLYLVPKFHALCFDQFRMNTSAASTFR